MRDLRHTLTHLQAIDEVDILRFPGLSVIASMSGGSDYPIDPLPMVQIETAVTAPGRPSRASSRAP